MNNPSALVVVAVAALTAHLTSAREPVDYHVLAVTPTISNVPIRPGHPLPPTCLPAGRFQITACRGEYEPASFVVESRAVLKNVRVQAGELRGDAGTVPAAASTAIPVNR